MARRVAPSIGYSLHMKLLGGWNLPLLATWVRITGTPRFFTVKSGSNFRNSGFSSSVSDVLQEHQAATQSSSSNQPRSLVTLHQPSNAPIAVMTLDRRELKNSISQRFLQDFDKCIFNGLLPALALQSSDPIPESNNCRPPRALLLWSSDSTAFCAGADLKERSKMTASQIRNFVFNLRNSFHALSKLPIPTIACMDGSALGGGFELAMGCDFRIASSQGGLFGLPEARLGIIPGAGGTQRLPRLVGLHRAKELIFKGKKLTAEQALKYGLIDYVDGINDAELQEALKISRTTEEVKSWINSFYDACNLMKTEQNCVDVTSPGHGSVTWGFNRMDGQVFEAARNSRSLLLGWMLCGELLDSAPIALRVAKQVIHGGASLSLEEALQVEKEGYDQILDTTDRLEALAAFKEKRKPIFKGQ